jgi:hypothetical protein
MQQHVDYWMMRSDQYTMAHSVAPTLPEVLNCTIIQKQEESMHAQSHFVHTKDVLLHANCINAQEHAAEMMKSNQALYLLLHTSRCM